MHSQDWYDAQGLTPKSRAYLGRIIGILIVAGAIVAGMAVSEINFIRPRTNDAIVRANIVGIAPEVDGRIVELPVEDNQRVKKGDLLYLIDPRPYQAKLAQAKAELMIAQKEVEASRASTNAAASKVQQLGHDNAAATAQIAKLQAEYTYQQDYLERLKPLLEKVYVTADRVREATSKRDAALAALQDAQAKQRSTQAAMREAGQHKVKEEALITQFGDINARVEAARAKVMAAELDVEYCQVRAPFDAYITNLNIREGEYAKQGAQIFALVDDRHWYALAAFRETYLSTIRPGMEAEVFLVSYPGKRFRGRVTGIGWANSPDNAKQDGVLQEVNRTLNWVILASRFQVRVEILDRDPNFPLRMGMTAFVTVEGLPKAAKLAVSP